MLGQMAYSGPAGLQAQSAVQQIAKQAGKTLTNNNLAAQVRLGGKFTQSGLENAAKEAQLDGMDRLRAKQLIGLGGSLSFIRGDM